MGALDRIFEMIGLQGEVDENVTEEVVQEEPEPQVQEAPRKSPFSRNSAPSSNLVGLPGGASGATMKVVISEPTTLKDAQELADQLKSRKQVIINLENTPREASQRIIDFISGTVYAIEGQSQKVGGYIFVFTPKNMEISKDERTEGGRRTTGSSSMFFVPSDEEGK